MGHWNLMARKKLDIGPKCEIMHTFFQPLEHNLKSISPVHWIINWFPMQFEKNIYVCFSHVFGLSMLKPAVLCTYVIRDMPSNKNDNFFVTLSGIVSIWINYFIEWVKASTVAHLYGLTYVRVQYYCWIQVQTSADEPWVNTYHLVATAVIALTICQRCMIPRICPQSPVTNFGTSWYERMSKT